MRKTILLGLSFQNLQLESGPTQPGEKTRLSATANVNIIIIRGVEATDSFSNGAIIN